MQQGWFYDFSNYGSYERLTLDGHDPMAPGLFGVGGDAGSLCSGLSKFCQKYKPKPKPEKRNHWGSKKLAALRQKMKAKKVSPGQKSLWESWNLPMDEIVAVAKKFVLANCYDPEYCRFAIYGYELTRRCQVTDRRNT
jgi:putative transposase